MKKIVINETRLLEEVKKLEEKREEQINLITRLISLCEVTYPC